MTTLKLLQVLEEEFKLLHGTPPSGLSCEGSEAARLRALRSLIHGLEEKPAALCLSGGGIRSATFSLGVLQGLARIGWLDKFHYLSTVSGGGYIGGWLSSWIQRSGLEAVLLGLKSARDAGDALRAEPAPIRWLRWYANYLSPKWGLSVDFLTLIATFLRNLLLNWVVLLPLIAAVLTVPRLNLAWIEHGGGWAFVFFGFFVACLLGGIGIAYAVSDLPGDGTMRPQRNHFATYGLLPLVVAAALLSWVWASYTRSPGLRGFGWVWFGWCVLGSTVVHVVSVIAGILVRGYRRGKPWELATGPVAPSLAGVLAIIAGGPAVGAVLFVGSIFTAGWLSQSANHRQAVELYAAFAVPSILGCCWLWIAAYVGLVHTTEDDREWWARASACILAVAVTWLAGNALVIFGPTWASGRMTSAIASAGGLSGVLTATLGYFSKNGLGVSSENKPGVAAFTGRMLLNIGALVFIIALLFLVSAGESAFLGRMLRLDGYADVLHYTPAWKLEVALVVLAALSVGASWFIGINRFSLHGMYGNRLVRAYLGATRLSRQPHRFTGFDPSDSLPMKEMANHKRLFHVLNLTLNMVKGERLEWQQRKAASFTVSPLHCGSLEVAYQPTHSPGPDDEHDYAGGMSLGRTMTISGAAASPNMGYHSSPLVTFVMTFFNVRLGWWLPNPRWVTTKREPMGLLALINEALGRTTDQSAWVYLSDGGHFENLGLYEMVLRRCHKIVVVDAGCDPEYHFEDLENAIRKIRTDLGIPIEFPPDGLPTPGTARKTRIHYTIGSIKYTEADPGGVDGYIVYVKPVLSEDEPIDVWRYAETHRDRGNLFPQQTTADQFFDEAQFESYRELGLHSVLSGFPTTKWEDSTWKKWKPPASPDGDGAPPPESPTSYGEPPTGLPGGLPRPSIGVPVAAKPSLLGLSAWPGWVALASVPAATSFVVYITQQPPATALITPTPTTAIAATITPPPTSHSEALPLVPHPTIMALPSPMATLPTPIAAIPAVAVVVQPAEGGRIDRIMLPIFEEARGCQGKPDTCQYGLNIDPASIRVLQELTRVLVGCVPSDGPKITVNVRGFASSSEFKGAPDGNLELAELRAKKVASAMIGTIGYEPNRLNVKPLPWKTPKKMELARHYVDVETHGRYWAASGVLNRRAEIIFSNDLGTCDVEDVLERVFPNWQGEPP